MLKKINLMRSEPEGIKEKPSLTDYDQVWEHSTKATQKVI